MQRDIAISSEFQQVWPGAVVGVIILEQIQIGADPVLLQDAKQKFIQRLHERFPNREKLRSHPVIQAYTTYYKTFKKTYHVLHQLESILFDARPLPASFLFCRPCSCPNWIICC